jgi:hypothetical protein
MVDEVLAATGWPSRVVAEVATTPAPSDGELAALRELHRTTGEAHHAGP